jgi:hypothetical protein
MIFQGFFFQYVVSTYVANIKSGPLIKKGQKILKKIIHDLNYK